jgi:hypothetical protein
MLDVDEAKKGNRDQYPKDQSSAGSHIRAK